LHALFDITARKHSWVSFLSRSDQHKNVDDAYDGDRYRFGIKSSNRFGIKRKFANRQTDNSIADSRIFEFNDSQSSSETSTDFDGVLLSTHVSDRKSSTSVQSLQHGVQICADTPDNNTEPLSSFEDESTEVNQCYICTDNEMVLADGSVRMWTRNKKSKLFLQQG
jgi:hypothetical protein